MDNKRRPPEPAGPAPKRLQGPNGHGLPDMEYEDVDEDVFIEDYLLAEDLHQAEEVQARLAKWSRPPVSITDTQKQRLSQSPVVLSRPCLSVYMTSDQRVNVCHSFSAAGDRLRDRTET